MSSTPNLPMGISPPEPVFEHPKCALFQDVALSGDSMGDESFEKMLDEGQKGIGKQKVKKIQHVPHLSPSPLPVAPLDSFQC